MRKLAFILASVLCGSFCSCGLFTPRDDFEPPESDANAGDPYSFRALLQGSVEQFSKLDWYELFDDEFEYINVRLANIVFDKPALINRLSLQHDIFPRIIVTWVKNEDLLVEVTTITIRNIFYTIAAADAPETLLYSGRSGFVIVRGPDQIWRIRSWIDEPSGEAFFSPAGG